MVHILVCLYWWIGVKCELPDKTKVKGSSYSQERKNQSLEIRSERLLWCSPHIMRAC